MSSKKQSLPPINHALKANIPVELLELPKALRRPEDFTRETTVLESLSVNALEKYHRSQLREFDLQSRQFVKKSKSLSKKDVKDFNKYRSDLKGYLEIQQRDELMEMKRILDVSEDEVEAQRKALKEKKLQQAEKKRQKELDQKLERERLTKEAESNPNSAKNLEMSAIVKILAENNQIIKEIDADGHCLYRSIADQIEYLQIPLHSYIHLDSSSMDYSIIRKICSDSIRASKEMFLPFLGIESNEEFEHYLRKVEHSSEWGGQIELQAFANAARVAVHIIQSGTPSFIIVQPWTEEPLHKIFLTYHKQFYSLGEHYNSVRNA